MYVGKTRCLFACLFTCGLQPGAAQHLTRYQEKHGKGKHTCRVVPGYSHALLTAVSFVPGCSRALLTTRPPRGASTPLLAHSARSWQTRVRSYDGSYYLHVLAAGTQQGGPTRAEAHATCGNMQDSMQEAHAACDSIQKAHCCTRGSSRKLWKKAHACHMRQQSRRHM